MSAPVTVNAFRRAIWNAPHDHPKPIQRLVALAMAESADWKTGRNCYPGEELIAARTGLSTRAVRENRRKLEQQGWLVLQGPRGSTKGSGTRFTKYSLAIPTSDQGSRVTDDPGSQVGEGTSDPERANQCSRITRPLQTEACVPPPPSGGVGEPPASNDPAADVDPQLLRHVRNSVIDIAVVDMGLPGGIRTVAEAAEFLHEDFEDPSLLEEEESFLLAVPERLRTLEAFTALAVAALGATGPDQPLTDIITPHRNGDPQP